MKYQAGSGVPAPVLGKPAWGEALSYVCEVMPSLRETAPNI
jgi:hypothetical protein